MELLSKSLILQDFPLFAGLSDEERKYVEERSSIIECKKGWIIYQEGNPADAFYCLILGRVVIYTANPGGSEVILEYLHRGKYFGIISLLTGGSHSVTAKAINDCLLLIIQKEDFDSILKQIPRLAIDLSLSLSRRLKNKDIHQKTIFESTIISIFSSYSQAGKSIYSLNLSLSLKKETNKSLIVLDICSADKTHSFPKKLDIAGGCRVVSLSEYNLLDYHGVKKDFIAVSKFNLDLACISYKPDDDSCVKKLLAILSFLVNDYHYIILDLPSFMDPFVFSVLNQSDLIHILSSPEQLDLKKTRHLIERLKSEFDFQEKKVSVIINQYKLAKTNYQQQAELVNHSIFATLPRIEMAVSDRLTLDDPDCEYSKAIRRISRNIGDCLVGLALGVGVAYGFCHIGVLKVIEEKKIPLDVISGSSVGSLIAAFWAVGMSSREILEVVKNEFREPKSLWSMMDFTFPLLGFIKGNNFYNLLKKYLGNKTFNDVKLPLKIVATDVKKKIVKIFDSGLLVDAVMTSCAMPGVFRPFRVKENMLFDGGVTTPLPTEALFKMGVRKIIAVNVTPSREDITRQYENMKMQINKKEVLKRSPFSLNKYLLEKLKINILDIIFSSIEMMQSELAEKEAQLADVVLHPNTHGMHWMELHKAEDFAKKGEEETIKNLDKILQLINE